MATFRKGNYVADLGAMVVTGLGKNLACVFIFFCQIIDRFYSYSSLPVEGDNCLCICGAIFMFLCFCVLGQEGILWRLSVSRLTWSWPRSNRSVRCMKPTARL